MGVIGDSLEILNLVQKGANVDLYSKLGKLVDEIRDLYEERERLEQENKALREELRFKGSFVRVRQHVYVDGDDYPMCSRCADVDHRPVHLIEQRTERLGLVAVCPECKSHHRHLVRRSNIKPDEAADM